MLIPAAPSTLSPARLGVKAGCLARRDGFGSALPVKVSTLVDCALELDASHFVIANGTVAFIKQQLRRAQGSDWLLPPGAS